MKTFEPIHELTREVMEAYLAGTLNDSQQHQVEKLMLEDDFATEAMDGYSMLKKEERKESLGRIRSALDERIGTKDRSFHIRWYAVAAAVAVLLSATYLVLRTPGEETPSLEEKDNSLAYRQEAPLKKAEEIPPQEQVSESAEDKSIPEPIEEAPVAALSDEDTEDIFKDTVGMIHSDISPERISQIDATQLDSQRINETLPVSASNLDKTQAISGRIAGEPIEPDVARLAGRVILQDGTPVANVNILIDEQRRRSTKSDETGNFEINANSDETLVLSFMGLKSKEIQGKALSDSPDKNIVMDQESVTLSELVISSPSAEQATTRGAHPEIDDQEYQAYLNSAVNYPDVDDPLSGEVVIRVSIESDGTISNTKIIRSLSEPYDVEAIRVIREGPAWRPALKKGEAVSDKVRVKVLFESRQKSD